MTVGKMNDYDYITTNSSLAVNILNCSAWPVTRDRRAEILRRQKPVGRVTCVNISCLFYRGHLDIGNSNIQTLS